jgi:hypothetical protein
MLHAAMVCVIVRGVDGAHVVKMKVHGRRDIFKGKFGVQAPKVDCLFGCLSRSHELGLAGR